MKLIIVACALVAVAIAAPPARGPSPAVPISASVSPVEGVQIIRSDYKQEADGSYTSVVETNDGYHRQETGELVEVPNEEGTTVKVLIVRGSYGYTDPEGNPQDITYVADQNGFHPEGPSIPKLPEPSSRR